MTQISERIVEHLGKRQKAIHYNALLLCSIKWRGCTSDMNCNMLSKVRSLGNMFSRKGGAVSRRVYDVLRVKRLH